jgi:hypothetical protein
MTTFTDAPWYALYMQTEYKLEETTTHLNFWKDRYDIVMAYATPVGIWGLRLAVAGLLAALIVLVVRRVRLRREIARCCRRAMRRRGGRDHPPERRAEGRAERAGAVLAASLFTLLTLAPMAGLLDTRLYSFSGAFLTLQRYTLQWFMLACAAIASTLAAAEAEWPALLKWGVRAGGGLWLPCAGACLRRGCGRGGSGGAGGALCALAFVQGTKESGYANSFYRYGRPMLTDGDMAQDAGFLKRYDLLLQLNNLVPQDEKILVTRPGYQYALRARGYVLTSNPIVTLMDLPLSEIGAALKEDERGGAVHRAGFLGRALLRAFRPERVLKRPAGRPDCGRRAHARLPVGRNACRQADRAAETTE